MSTPRISRIAFVTGGARGIGAAIAAELAARGCTVIAPSRAELDLAQPASIDAYLEANSALKIDILINNAGISWGVPTEKMTLAEWNKVIETNLTGTFLCAQAAGRIMLKQESGKIINMASVAGIRGAPPKTVQAIAYHASKGGVISFTHDLAVKWARHNIQVNAIAPGWFPTHMSDKVIEYKRDYLLSHIPARRFGSDYDLKGAAVFLASDASSYVSGHVLVVDGGQSA